MNIIITGASKGIGLAIAHRLAMQTSTTHFIGLCSREESAIAGVASVLKKDFPQHQYFAQACNVGNEGEVNAFVSEFESRCGAVDVLINNAGFGIFKPITSILKSECDSMLATNLRGPFLFSRAVLPKMREKKSGTILSISSLAGKHGFSGGAAYCASKFALRGMMQSLFLEVRSDNIRVVTINPGSVETGFYKSEKATSSTRSTNALHADDVAACVELALGLPINADITDLDVRPTNPKG
ncbi:MAG: SDR family NAD(P)-dependent oxidoreductase [bacterium]